MAKQQALQVIGEREHLITQVIGALEDLLIEQGQIEADYLAALEDVELAEAHLAAETWGLLNDEDTIEPELPHGRKLTADARVLWMQAELDDEYMMLRNAKQALAAVQSRRRINDEHIKTRRAILRAYAPSGD